MKTVVFYRRSAATMEELMKVYPRHKAYEENFAKDGGITGIGVFTHSSDNDMDDFASMGIFKDRQTAEDFVRQDPFVLEGLVAKAIFREWGDELLP
ncbi:MAG: YciI family protein [Chitinophagaceae bacterium]|nr:YciI family protein [Chitinophagaceae bacterium]